MDYHSCAGGNHSLHRKPVPLKPKIQDKEKRLEEAGVIPGDFPDCAGL